MNRYTPAKKAEERITASSPQNNADLIALIQKFETQIKLALPRHLSPSRMTRIIITEVRKTPLLASCDRASFFGAIITCAQLGLEPGAAMGQAYLRPVFNNKTGKHEVELWIGYQGKIDLAERDGRVTVEAHVVYERDEFDYSLGTACEMRHKPYFGDEDPGKLVASYAVARYKDGRLKFRVLSRSEIEKAREASMMGKKGWGPWKDHYAEMARKTAIHRLFKMLPKSPELARAQELEDKVEIGESQDMGEVFGEFKDEHKIQIEEGTPEAAPEEEKGE